MKRKSQFDRTPAMKWAVVLAILVFVVIATAESVHIHPHLLTGDSDGSESHCPLCMAAHATAAPTVISISPVLAFVYAPAESSEPQLQSRLFVPAASIRPPPAI